MANIELLESFKTGHPEIDADHQNIVDIINDISGAIEDELFGLCKDLFESFINIVKEHFAREEGILRSIDFPRIDKHCAYHRQLLLKAEKTRGLCADMTDKAELEVCFDELTSFLIDDIVKGDLDFKSHLAVRGLV